MNEKTVRKICMSLPGATEELLWKDEHRVFKVGGKMFAILLVGGPFQGAFSFKCDKETFGDLIETPGVVPTPYMARHHWVRIDPKVCTLEPQRIKELLHQSYKLVFEKLPKKTQAALKRD